MRTNKRKIMKILKEAGEIALEVILIIISRKGGGKANGKRRK